MTNNLQRARAHLDAAQVYRDNLDDEYQRAKHDRAVIADLHASIKFSQDQANALACIAIAAELAHIRARLVEATDLTPRPTPPDLLAERFQSGTSR